jgi:hypothetical protein
LGGEVASCGYQWGAPVLQVRAGGNNNKDSPKQRYYPPVIESTTKRPAAKYAAYFYTGIGIVLTHTDMGEVAYYSVSVANQGKINKLPITATDHALAPAGIYLLPKKSGGVGLRSNRKAPLRLHANIGRQKLPAWLP